MRCWSIVIARLSLVLALLTLTCSCGCRSTNAWKMPSWFSGRQPDADKLAGRIDTPTSPAEKYSPVAINNNAPVGRGLDPAGAPVTASAVVANSNAKNPIGGAGLAAQSNGYQTGPYVTSNGYETTSQPTATTERSAVGGAASSSLVSSSSPASSSSSFVNPYGGSYNGVSGTTNAPNVAANTTGLVPATPVSSTLPEFPGVGNTPNFGSPNSDNLSMPEYPSLQGNFASGTATGGNTTSAQEPAASAYQPAAAASTSGYAPGTTGRSTNYNFGTTPNQTNPRSLPANTATGDQLLIR
jgi:hypothetical protein